jgi:two-component system nitrate/nitrite response regulator NarL
MESNLVLVLGRNEIAREGLRRILADEFTQVEAMAPEEAIGREISERLSPQLIIVDAASDIESMEACRALRDRYPRAKLVLMGESHDLDTIATAFKAGVDGYLIKAIQCGPLVGALKLILLGEKILPSQTVSALVEPRSKFACGNWDAIRTGENLSDREIEILECLIRGDANKLISRQLTITEATVKVHVKAILRKLRVQNRTQAAIWAVNRGLNQMGRPVAEMTHH